MNEDEAPVKHGTVTVFNDRVHSFLVVRDRLGRKIKAGPRRVTFSGPPGIYQVEVRVPGTQSEDLVVVEGGRERTEAVAGMPPRPVVPPPSLLGEGGPLGEYAVVREATERRKPRKTKAKTGEHGWLVLTLWQGAKSAPVLLEPVPIEVRQNDNEPPLAAQISGGSGFQVISVAAPAGTCQLEFHINELEKRTQAVLVEAGWTTDVYLRVSGSRLQTATAVAALFSHKARPLPAAERMASAAVTEAALDALSIGHSICEDGNLLDPENLKEPIRALAAGYARLVNCCAITDRLLFDRWRRGNALEDEQQEQARQHLNEWKKPLQEVAALGIRLAELLPHSVDARLMAVAAIWERAALEELARGSAAPPANRLSAPADWFRPDVRLARRRQLSLIVKWLAVAVATLLLWGLLFGPKTESDTEPASLWTYALPASVLAAGFIIAWVRLKRTPLLFDEPPVFAEGMKLLLRLSTLYSEVCAADGRITRVALRLSTDSIWTRWNSSISGREASERFTKALRELETTLMKHGGAPVTVEAGPDVAPARNSELLHETARYVALSLQLPLSLLLAELAQTGEAALRRLREASPEALQTFFLKRLSWTLRSNKALEERRGCSFSMVEILLVLAVLAVLAGCLFPVFARSREGGSGISGFIDVGSVATAMAEIFSPTSIRSRDNSRRVGCQGNERQIGLALQQYVIDYDEKYPPAAIGGSGVSPPDSNKAQVPSFGWADAVYPYLQSSQAFQCPSEKTPAAESPHETGYTDYYFNRNLSRRRKADVNNPANTILFGDGNTGNAALALNDFPLGSPAMKRHEGGTDHYEAGANYAFSDGHVKWFSEDTVRKNATFALPPAAPAVKRKRVRAK